MALLPKLRGGRVRQQPEAVRMPPADPDRACVRGFARHDAGSSRPGMHPIRSDRDPRKVFSNLL